MGVAENDAFFFFGGIDFVSGGKIWKLVSIDVCVCCGGWRGIFAASMASCHLSLELKLLVETYVAARYRRFLERYFIR